MACWDSIVGDSEWNGQRLVDTKKAANSEIRIQMN